MMLEQQQWRQAEVVRAITLTVFDWLTEEQADIIPPGFSNHIRWNLGHILMTQDQLAVQFAGIRSMLPDTYISLFGNRSRPADWTVPAPTLETIRTELLEQTDKLQGILSGRLNEKLMRPFARLGRPMETIGELLSFSLYHEGVHQGAISGLRKAIAAAGPV